MPEQQVYLVIDIGTGNVRTALVGTDAKVVHIERNNVIYERDTRYPDALHFHPDELWNQIIGLIKKTMDAVPGARILAITASSQREGIVLVDGQGKSLIGLPNHDHRGRQWEDRIQNKDRVYELTGRYPTSLFSALKLIGIREKRQDLFDRTASIMSISDWAQYMLCGEQGYEHAQASETVLYDVGKMDWSDELCGIFDVSPDLLPGLHHSGSVLGNVLPDIASQTGLKESIPVIVGGADTQLAVKSTRPAQGDIVLVSGTTTPVVKIIENYRVDEKQRTWTGRHIEQGQFVLEANAGVTGLNYQRLREVFYPDQGYDRMEQELAELSGSPCIASLGSLVASEPAPLTQGGFLFDAPVSHELSKAHFVQSVLWDIACSIKENVDVLCEMEPYKNNFVWGCGGGFQSQLLTQYLANLTGKRILIQDHFQHASVAGGALVCSGALGQTGAGSSEPKEVIPNKDQDHDRRYEAWKKFRAGLRRMDV